MPITRRSALKSLAATPAILAAGSLAGTAAAETPATDAPATKRGVKVGKLKQSVCNWSWGHGLESLCKFCVEYGLTGIDLLDPGDFAMIKKYNLQCSLVSGIGNGFGIGNGLNRVKNHDGYLKFLMERVDAASENGFKQVICFSGNRAKDLTDAEGLDNCVPACIKLAEYAKTKNVTITMELLNSKDHREYMCDTSKWGVELCEKVARGMNLDPAKSGAKDSHFGLLYDVYHMQRMEGDLINTIRQNKRWYNHYHTAGNPGRGPIHKPQEMMWRPIAQAILKAIEETGQSDTFMAHEFCGGSAEDHLAAVELCDVE